MGVVLAGVFASPTVAATIWLEAELFDDHGGWTVDSQFIEQMGSSYLLAADRLYQVEDAHTEFQVRQAGAYTLWARCRNWLPRFSPGRFQVKIDGKASPVTFGAQKDPQWTWVKGGQFELSAAKHRLTLHDLTGHYGRCDAIVLSSDPGFAPPSDLKGLRTARRELAGLGAKVEDRGEYDVVVIGGGVAGSCAAIASARHGAKTVLIQDRPVLGGNASEEIRVWVQGAVGGGLRNARESGLVEEMLTGVHAAGSESKSLLRMAKAEPNLTLCLQTRATKALGGTEGHIDAVEAVHVVTAERYRFKGKIFIDCTGDGVIGASAGAVCRVGREGRAEFNESIAPAEPDRRTLGSSLLWYIEDMGAPIPFVAPAWVIKFPSADDLPHRRHDRPRKGHWWIEFGGGTPPPDLKDVVENPNQLDTIRDAEEIRDHLLRALYGVWDHCKNHPDHEKAYADYRLKWVGHVAGKRESRRLIGDYIMTQHDVQSARVFPDAVAYGGWSIDLHPPEGIYDPGRPSIHNYLDKPYTTPFRSLYSKNIDNLMMAGRDISVSHVALGTTRVMATCGVMGQAVGTAAALCVEHGSLPREVGRRHITELQQQLLKDDCYIPGFKNEDPEDLARTAKVSASSKQTYCSHKPGIRGEIAHPMNHRRAEMFRVTADRMDAILVYVISHREGPVKLSMAVRKAEGEGEFRDTPPIGRATVEVPARHKGWVKFAVRCDVEPGKKYWFCLPPSKGLELQLMTNAPAGSQRAYFGAGEWQESGGHYAFILEPPIAWTGNWGPENVIDGVARPVEDEPHKWVSDPNASLPQWIELDWGEVREVAEIRLTFDNNINARYVPDPPAERLVRDYRVLADGESGWREIVRVADNVYRHRVHRFDPVKARRVRVEAIKTYGAPAAHVFEVRLYGPDS